MLSLTSLNSMRPGRTPVPLPPPNNIKISSQWVSSLSFCYFGKFCLGQMALSAAWSLCRHCARSSSDPLGWLGASDCKATFKYFHSFRKYWISYEQSDSQLSNAGRWSAVQVGIDEISKFDSTVILICSKLDIIWLLYNGWGWCKGYIKQDRNKRYFWK